jgi:GTPase SAR1 family protein
VLDLTNRSSFEKLDSWIRDINDNGPKDLNVFLIANKCDEVDNRVITSQECNEFAIKNNLPFMEVSALTGKNVYILFENLTRTMVKKESERTEKKPKKQKIDKSHVKTDKSVTLDQSSVKDRKSNQGCCK